MTIAPQLGSFKDADVLTQKMSLRNAQTEKTGKELPAIANCPDGDFALLAAGSQAAVLTNIEGVVQVNHGDGFKLASANAVLAPGDRVRAAAGSAAIQYENGCSMKVRPKQT